MAYRSGFGTKKQRHEGGMDPNAEQARKAIREVRGGEGEGKAAETITSEGGRARPESGGKGGAVRKDKA